MWNRWLWDGPACRGLSGQGWREPVRVALFSCRLLRPIRKKHDAENWPPNVRQSRHSRPSGVLPKLTSVANLPGNAGACESDADPFTVHTDAAGPGTFASLASLAIPPVCASPLPVCLAPLRIELAL